VIFCSGNRWNQDKEYGYQDNNDGIRWYQEKALAKYNLYSSNFKIMSSSDYTERERQVLKLYDQGKTTLDIAKILRMSLRDINYDLRIPYGNFAAREPPYDDHDDGVIANYIFNELCRRDGEDRNNGNEPAWHDITVLAQELRAYDNRIDVAYLAEEHLLDRRGFIERDPHNQHQDRIEIEYMY
jgi:hypothetical protein